MARRVKVELVGDARRLNAAFASAGVSAQRFGRTTSRTRSIASSALKGLGVGAGIAGVAGIAAAFKSSIDKAASFEQSLNSLQAVSGANRAEMAKFQRQAIALGNDIKLPGTSAKDATEAMLQLVKGGLSVQDTMKSVRGTLLLAAAAEIDNAHAAEIQANALNAFHLPARNAGYVSDLLANAANRSSVEITDVADSMQMAAAVFSAFQGPAVGAKGALSELTTAIALLGNAGMKGSDAGTSLKQSLMKVAAPSEKAKGLMRGLFLSTGEGAKAFGLLETSLHDVSKKARDAATDQLEKLYGSTKGIGDVAFDAAGKMRSLPEIIDNMRRATQGMTEEQRDYAIATIFGTDSTRAIVALMNAGPAAWAKMERAVNKQGGAQRVAAAKMKGFKGAMDALHSSLETLQITVGLQLLPVLTRLIRRFNAWVGNAKNQKKVIDTVRHAIRVLSDVMQRAARFARGISSAVGGWGNAFKLILAGVLFVKLLKVAGAIAKIRREIILTKGVGGIGGIGGPGVGLPGGKGKGGKGIGKLLPFGAGMLGVAGAEVAVLAVGAAGDQAMTPDRQRAASVGSQASRATRNLFPVLNYLSKDRHISGKNAMGRAALAIYAQFRRGYISAATAERRLEKSAYGRDLVIHNHVHLDGKQVAHTVTKHQQRGGQLKSTQRTGRHAGGGGR